MRGGQKFRDRDLPHIETQLRRYKGPTLDLSNNAFMDPEAVARFLERNKRFTHIDLSGNQLRSIKTFLAMIEGGRIILLHNNLTRGHQTRYMLAMDKLVDELDMSGMGHIHYWVKLERIVKIKCLTFSISNFNFTKDNGSSLKWIQVQKGLEGLDKLSPHVQFTSSPGRPPWSPKKHVVCRSEEALKKAFKDEVPLIYAPCPINCWEEWKSGHLFAACTTKLEKKLEERLLIQHPQIIMPFIVTDTITALRSPIIWSSSELKDLQEMNQMLLQREQRALQSTRCLPRDPMSLVLKALEWVSPLARLEKRAESMTSYERLKMHKHFLGTDSSLVYEHGMDIRGVPLETLEIVYSIPRCRITAQRVRVYVPLNEHLEAPRIFLYNRFDLPKGDYGSVVVRHQGFIEDGCTFDRLVIEAPGLCIRGTIKAKELIAEWPYTGTIKVESRRKRRKV